MVCLCSIVPIDVLVRFSKDDSLSEAERNIFSATAILDVEQRRLRLQASKLTRVSLSLAPQVRALAAAPAVTIFDCQHVQVLPGALVPRPGSSSDMTAKYVFDETTNLAKFFSQVFGRNSIDGAGMTLQSSIHYGLNYNNAFWNGSQMTYGDGDGQIFVDFSKSNDVIAHELMHGVTQHTLQLNYQNEPGGLNESLSDCFGSMFRQWEANQDVTQADWLIGKDIMGPAAIAKGYSCLRDMANPAGAHCLTPQPTHYSHYRTGMDPHESSGIPNLAFATICKAVGGNSWDKVGQIWYQTVIGTGAKPAMKMKAFAKQIRRVAAQLYPGDAPLNNAVDAGWRHVGL